MGDLQVGYCNGWSGIDRCPNMEPREGRGMNGTALGRFSAQKLTAVFAAEIKRLVSFSDVLFVAQYL